MSRLRSSGQTHWSRSAKLGTSATWTVVADLQPLAVMVVRRAAQLDHLNSPTAGSTVAIAHLAIINAGVKPMRCTAAAPAGGWTLTGRTRPSLLPIELIRLPSHSLTAHWNGSSVGRRRRCQAMRRLPRGV